MKNSAMDFRTGFFGQRERSRKWWIVFAPVLILAGVLGLEVLSAGVRVTPSLLMIGLAAMAPLLSPRQVVVWAMVFFIPVVVTLIVVPIEGIYAPEGTIFLRCFGFLVASILAYWISRYREQSERQAASLGYLFDHLCSPIIVSDKDGNIVSANKACCELLGLELDEIKASTFFSLFLHPDRRGKEIEEYLLRFDARQPSESAMRLSLRGTEELKDIRGTGVRLSLEGVDLLVTQLHIG